MARSSSLASVHIDVAEEAEEVPVAVPDGPFRILVVGNFSGGASRIRKPVAVDRDNFDEVLALLAPEVSLEFAGTRLAIRFNELDDFHPDRLFRRLAPFEALRERVASGEGLLASTAPPDVSGADLLRSMMGEGPAPAKPAPARSDWDRMLHDMVAPYAEAKPDPRRPEYLAQTDAAITGEMRGVLHHRDFQDLEAAWRGLFFLIRRLPTDEDLKVYVWDKTQAELMSAEGLALFRRIAVDETVGTAGAERWAAIAGLYYFAPEHEAALAQIAAIARAAGAPFLSGVAPDVVGLTRVFETLRHSGDARWIGLAMPRFLLRLPYGAKTDATEEFDFEEMPSPPEHERYLWGNPAVACAYLLGEAFSRYGWRMRPGIMSQIDGLPAHVYKDGGESQLKPCAEVLLTESAVEMLLERGFMPLVSYKDSDRVRVARFQSIAAPAAPLAGQWG
jgi:type VI secretion system protein ImpC